MAESFGTEIHHSSLDKIKARTELNETLWIFFFGVHTSNTVRIANRLAQEKPFELVAQSKNDQSKCD